MLCRIIAARAASSASECGIFSREWRKVAGGVISPIGDACRWIAPGISTSSFRRWAFDGSAKLTKCQSRARDRKQCLDRVKYMNQRLRTCRTYGLPHVFAMTWLVCTYDSHCESAGSLNADRKCRNVRPIRAMLQVESKSSDCNRENLALLMHAVFLTPSSRPFLSFPPSRSYEGN